jgi:Zn-dependent M28 family amino/carboxypeptidase
MRVVSHRLLSSLLLSSALVASPAGNWDSAGKAWWSHVQYLASDELEGRNVGSAGYEKAAQYVAAQFKEAGLKPAGVNGYFQKVQFTETTLDSARVFLALIREGKSLPVPVPAEAHLGYGPETASSVEAPIVFAGYGLVIPEAHHNDLLGLPVKGAIVAFLTGGPANIDGNLRSHYSSSAERWKAFRAAGAIGYISIPNPREMEIPWARQSAAWGMPHMSLSDRALAESAGLKFNASWNPERAGDLFAGSGHTFSEVTDAANNHKPLPHFALPCSVKANVPVSMRRLDSENVAGLWPGSDPNLKAQVVAISAHLDHLGKGKPVNGDAIYNGAMDDASGVASLIEIAKSFGAHHVSAKRSVLFLAVTGEEKGELGSHYFAGRPTVKGHIVADLNMDMFLPLFPLRWLEVQGLNESTLGDDIRQVAEAAGVKVQADKEPNRNRFIRSDQYSFIKKGVPALAFKFGFLPGGPEEKVFKDWYTNRYHGVADDVNQPVDLAAAAQFNAILRALALRVADANQPPAWKPTSFFKRFAAAKD